MSLPLLIDVLISIPKKDMHVVRYFKNLKTIAHDPIANIRATDKFEIHFRFGINGSNNREYDMVTIPSFHLSQQVC